jgi:NAD(P)-dependent dehydrogenase (short-subunit alcohol dehydrogenase family)
MTSQAGIKPQFPISTLGNYSVMKAGVIMLTRQLAVDLARHNVRVNAIALSQVPFDPPPTDPAIVEREKRTLAWMSSHTPMKRNAEHREIANGALFLASDASSYVTGHTLVIDGGFIL